MGKVKEYDKRRELINQVDKRDEIILDLEHRLERALNPLEKDKDGNTIVKQQKKYITVNWKENNVRFHELFYDFKDIESLFKVIKEAKDGVFWDAMEEAEHQAWKGEDEDFGK